MTKINKAVLAAVSSLALFGGALTLVTPAPADAAIYSRYSINGNTYHCYDYGYTTRCN